MSILSTGASFGAYRIIEPLGRGGMATVYRAYEAALDRYVALKVLPPEFLHEPTFGARFEREAKVVAKLEHPNIIPIFAFGIERGIPWMSMRLIGGGSLSGHLKHHTIGRARAVEIVCVVADALTYAHAHNVVHRDVKPQNILLDEQGRVYLADFGIARIVEGGPSLTVTSMITGTPYYMAPEQASGKPIDHRADVYALGVVAYELLTGSVPFAADTPMAVMMKQVTAEIPIPHPSLVPEPMLGALLKCLAKDPEERWNTPAEFADALTAGMSPGTDVQPVTQIRSRADERASAASLTPPPVIPLSVPSAAIPPSPQNSPLAAQSRRSSGMRTALIVGAALVVLAAIALGASGWFSGNRSETDAVTGDAVVPARTSATDGPVAAPPESTPAAAVGATPPVSTVPSSSAPAVEKPTVARPKAHAEPAAAASTTSSGATASTPPVAATPVPEPVAAPAPPPPAPPKDAHLFRMNAAMPIGPQVVVPVTLTSARFNNTKPDEIELQLAFECAKGHDQMVTWDVELFDETGKVLLTINGRNGIEEEDKVTFKKKQKVAASLMDAVKAFRVKFTTKDD